MILAFLVLGVGFYSLIWLLAAFQSSVTAGLIMSGVYAVLLLLGTVAYRIYKKAYEWEQGSIIREMKAIRLSHNNKPPYLNEQTHLLASLTVAQENREIAAMTTRTCLGCTGGRATFT